MSTHIDDLALKLRAVSILLVAGYDGSALLGRDLTDEQRAALRAFVGAGEKEVCQLADRVVRAMRGLVNAAADARPGEPATKLDITREGTNGTCQTGQAPRLPLSGLLKLGRSVRSQCDEGLLSARQ